jgi:hypothetical protein
MEQARARVLHHAGGELEQIQFLLGNVSIQTTERYLGCKQRLRNAMNNHMGWSRMRPHESGFGKRTAGGFKYRSESSTDPCFHIQSDRRRRSDTPPNIPSAQHWYYGESFENLFYLGIVTHK